MGKRDIHVVAVRKWVTFVLLILMSAAIAALVYSLSGRAYARGNAPAFGEVREVAGQLSNGSYSLPRLLAITAPAIFDMLIFVPWGALMFLLVSAPGRNVLRSYLITWIVGMSLALLLQLWQKYLPMKVTDINDCLWNGIGALLGGIAGQLRKGFRVRFE